MTLVTQRHFSYSRRRVNITRRSSPTFCRQNILLCNKSVSTNIYGGTKPQILKSQNYNFGVNFGIRGLLPVFQYSLVAWGLTTSPSTNVSTTFPASFFTLMPKGLTTGPCMTEPGLLLQT